ncbi:MAG: N-acetylmuramoyl-L-alanine amidase [Akkermansiaceae bacterium]|nr:N-acetylmuramoyl-L-alanine amidase [Akkermansiaceae bacterium]
MKWGIIIGSQCLTLLGVFVVLSSCSTMDAVKHRFDRSSAGSSYGATASSGNGYRLVPGTPTKSPAALYREVNVKQDIIPRGTHARKYRRPMSPKYITIHSTQNYSRSADALRHSMALKNGKLRAYKRKGGNRIGYLVWHYTTDQTRAVQHLPTDEQGEHADFDGPGNRYSIGIEMCENKGNSRTATIERTAKLTACLMHKYDIPLRKVVPHYHWPRRGLSQPHKNCPHYLLDNGHPGAKWQWFLAKVNTHYKSISGGPPTRVPMPVAPTRPSSSYGTPVATASRPVAVASAPRPVATPSRPVKKPAPRPVTRYHTVKRGDTLYSLSRRYHTSVSAIQRSNGMRSTTIGIGQRLRLP